MDNMQLQLVKLNKITSLELQEEYEEQLTKIIAEAKEINEINIQMNTLIKTQGEKINVTDKECDNTLTNIENSNAQLEKASEYQSSALYKKGILLTLCASIVSLPLAFTIGTKIAIGAGLGSVFLVGNYV